MKRTILFMACMLASVTMFAQNDYRPLVEEGKHWTYDNFMPLRQAKYDHYYYYDLKGDTLIAGYHCLKMYSDNFNNRGEIEYKGSLYEKNKKVYYFFPGKEEAELLYDFDCVAGDTLHVRAGNFVVKDIQTFDNGGIDIKIYTLYEKYDGMEFFWIEGVGATNDFFGMLPLDGNNNTLNACELNGEKIYQTIERDLTEEGYHKMAIEGKRWNYIHYHLEDDGWHEDPYSYVVKGDTIIRRTTYKKLYYQDEKTERFECLLLERGRAVYKNTDLGNNSYESPLLTSFFDFGRDDFGRVFTWKAQNDFGNTNWMVYGVDTIEVNNCQFRRFTCLQKYSKEDEKLTTIDYDGEGVWHDIWVEGIGSATSGIEDQDLYHEPEERATSNYTAFVSCYENGECIFTSQDFYKKARTPEYYPEGTKWTEIRLDTLRYDSWYSKVGDEWVPNFETIEYYVKGEFVQGKLDNTQTFKKVYSNGPEWTDSLTLMIRETDDYGYNCVMVGVPVRDYDGELGVNGVLAYQFDWSVGKGLYYQDIEQELTTYIVRYEFYYGIIDEIKEGYFGGVRPLKYVDLDGKAPECGKYDNPQLIDTNGGRIIQGIGITEWNDGECLFGPPDPYFALTGNSGKRHYRSMLVHFERNGEVLYDVWPKKEVAYRPFVEEGKVWKVGNTQTISDNVVNVVDYYYFDGDTIIDGKTCKQMMCQRFVNPDYTNEYSTPKPSLTKVGAWYEENQKVYYYDERKQSMVIKYDFSLTANDTLRFITNWSSPFIIGPKQTGGIEGYKGVYRDIRMCGDKGQSYHDTFWLEGIGCVRGPLSSPCDPILADPKPEFLMSCTVGDEVIYLNDEYEDGATPAEARKRRFDFSHTIKTKPKARRQSGEEQSLYGEYNDQQLGINLDPLYDAYQVRITDESGKLVYEKAVNAGSIVGLNIDISAYAKGRYTVTVENSNESFTGEFEAQTTGIEAIKTNKEDVRSYIYNLHGQRLNSLQKGLNIVNGRKLLIP